MSLQYVIDGYNIINHRLFPRASRKTRGSPVSLIELIKSKNLCGSLKNTVTIVFDGYLSDSRLKASDSRISVIFSEDSSADDQIKGIIERSQDKKNTVVVSDDKEIAVFVKSCGVKVMSVEEFIGRSPDDKRRAKEDLKTELNYSQVARINEELKKIWLE
jgi:predicted RNA-binding protein with PIN domain